MMPVVGLIEIPAGGFTSAQVTFGMVLVAVPAIATPVRTIGFGIETIAAPGTTLALMMPVKRSDPRVTATLMVVVNRLSVDATRPLITPVDALIARFSRPLPPPVISQARGPESGKVGVPDVKVWPSPMEVGMSG